MTIECLNEHLRLNNKLIFLNSENIESIVNAEKIWSYIEIVLTVHMVREKR